MLAYNGSIPGPTLRVRQGSKLTVEVENAGDLEGTVHWHGLRLENRYDGTTQAPMPIGGRFSYRLAFPDPGVYWYHPHIREDFGQELGLYGNIVVEPTEPDYWPPVNRELTLTLDDVLIEDGRIAPFSRADGGGFVPARVVSRRPSARYRESSEPIKEAGWVNESSMRSSRAAASGACRTSSGGILAWCRRGWATAAATSRMRPTAITARTRRRSSSSSIPSRPRTASCSSSSFGFTIPTVNRQGNDIGTSYRSAIFYVDDDQRRIAEETIAAVEASGQWPGKVVTEVSAAGPFWEAEPEHQDYLERYPNGYTCHFVRPDWVLPQRSEEGEPIPVSR